MNRKSIIKEYFILAVNEKGSMPVTRKTESNAGLVVAGMMDLLLGDVIAIEKKKITVVKSLPYDLKHIAPLYEYLEAKPRSAKKLMRDYAAAAGRNRLKQLTGELGEALLAEYAVVKGESGLLGNKTVYIPEQGCKEEIISAIKSAVTNVGEMTPHDIALLSILKETKNLNQYFSAYESKELKARLKEIKADPQNKQLANMIHYVSDMTAVMAAAAVTSS